MQNSSTNRRDREKILKNTMSLIGKETYYMIYNIFNAYKKKTFLMHIVSNSLEIEKQRISSSKQYDVMGST